MLGIDSRTANASNLSCPRCVYTDLGQQVLLVSSTSFVCLVLTACQSTETEVAMHIERLTTFG